MTTLRRRCRLAAVAAGVVTVAGCGGGGDADVRAPLVGRIDDAIEAIEVALGGPQDYYQISADADRVEFVMLGPEGPVVTFWSPDSDDVADPEPVQAPFTETFSADDLDFDQAAILDRIADELPDSQVLDFAITAAGGRPVYDARVQSDRGGILLVLLGPDGQILGVQST